MDTPMDTPLDTPVFPLSLAGRYFSVLPSSPSVDCTCTSSEPCQQAATHRVLSRATATVEWLCDTHALLWARSQGCNISAKTAVDAAAV
jgi:hypothetical protein